MKTYIITLLGITLFAALLCFAMSRKGMPWYMTAEQKAGKKPKKEKT